MEYMHSASLSESKDLSRAADAYLLAWRYASFGAWPIAATQSKRAAYQLGLQAFKRYAAIKYPQLEHLRMPFEDSEIVADLRMPEHLSSPAPVLIAISGLDSHKEQMTERLGPECFARGIGLLTVNAPGTAGAPVKADARGARMYSAVIDHLLSREDVDGRRIGVAGISLGGYWATKLAFLEASRLKLAVNWGGPLHEAWQSAQLKKALSSREYLFDLPEALMTVWDCESVEQLVETQPSQSIVYQNLTHLPTPAMLVVNGLKDSLVPADDALLLLRTGHPKFAWLNPEGSHLGRSSDWSDARIVREVILPWVCQAMQ